MPPLAWIRLSDSTDPYKLRRSPCTLDDQEAKAFFDRTTQLVDNRYKVRWPWKQISAVLPDNYALAFGRMRSLSMHMASDQHFLVKFHEEMSGQLKMGVVESCKIIFLTNLYSVHRR